MYLCIFYRNYNLLHTRPVPVLGTQFSPLPVKGKAALCLTTRNKAICHEDVWGSGGIVPPFLISTLVGGEWSASRPGRYTYGERALGALEPVWTTWRGEKSCPYQDWKSDPSAIQRVASRCTGRAILAYLPIQMLISTFAHVTRCLHKEFAAGELIIRGLIYT
jgi:hypothetical protein